ncbi:uncharacterized protein LOC117193635 [Drosophila miranda]|uniref:uncharacterized protein LOC117193635 n=1 Tax=Drosophila miranda TaxID=7229 RepID=UPI00143F32D8|nr:uncharacterized protein LOC117193635 [Drosophila miranda]
MFSKLLSLGLCLGLIALCAQLATARPQNPYYVESSRSGEGGYGQSSSISITVIGEAMYLARDSLADMALHSSRVLVGGSHNHRPTTIPITNSLAVPSADSSLGASVPTPDRQADILVEIFTEDKMDSNSQEDTSQDKVKEVSNGQVKEVSSNQDKVKDDYSGQVKVKEDSSSQVKVKEDSSSQDKVKEDSSGQEKEDSSSQDKAREVFRSQVKKDSVSRWQNNQTVLEILLQIKMRAFRSRSQEVEGILSSLVQDRASSRVSSSQETLQIPSSLVQALTARISPSFTSRHPTRYSPDQVKVKSSPGKGAAPSSRDQEVALPRQMMAML